MDRLGSMTSAQLAAYGIHGSAMMHAGERHLFSALAAKGRGDGQGEGEPATKAARPAARHRRPEMPLRPRCADLDCDTIVEAARSLLRSEGQRRHSWQLLELGFVALFCLVLALTLWLNQDSRSCAAKLYRDPVTGRMVNLEPTHASGKMRIMCARLGYPER